MRNSLKHLKWVIKTCSMSAIYFAIDENSINGHMFHMDMPY